jgi:lipoprotein NlpD
MTRVGCIFGVLIVLLLQGCMAGNHYTYGYYTGKTRPSVSTAVETTAHSSDVHIVAKGETLYSIAFACGEDVRTVAGWNHIRPPYTIYPNQQIRLSPPPAPVVTTPRARIDHVPIAAPPRHTVVKTYAQTSNSAKAKQTNSQKISWQWPTNGKIINTYAAKDTGKKGLDIAGKTGQPIYAAASGVVVYSGDGLRGYGRLIIIKHNDTYFSAYAHNRRLLVKDDQKVNKGQHIADMGNTEADQTMLHFEVRRDGKPVNPMQYLPKRR